MAYVNFSVLEGGPARVAEIPAAATPSAGLSALEWQVVAIARTDRLSSLGEPSRLAVALGSLFGRERPNPRLADAKLEALRRVSVLAWHRGYAVPPAEVAAFHEAGYTLAQLETLLASIDKGRQDQGRTSYWD